MAPNPGAKQFIDDIDQIGLGVTVKHMADDDDDVAPDTSGRKRYCVDCGSPIPNGAKYCPSCGREQ